MGHSERLQVLLVEDRIDAARAVAVACRDLTIPIDLIAVATMAAARAKLKATSFDVVLIDADLSERPGPDALAELRDERRSVPFVVLTRDYDPERAQDFLDVGADDWMSLADEMNSRMLARVMSHAIERHHLWQQVQETSHLDAMTGLLNLRGFRHTVRQQLALAARDLRPLALLLLDIDHMQDINNEFGWDEGDRVLETVGDVVRRTFRVSDIVGRTGDDEFAALLTGNGFRDVEAAVSRVTANLDLYSEAQVLPYSLTFSVGWTVTQPEQALGVDEALEAARAALLDNQHRADGLVPPRSSAENANRETVD